MLLLSLGRENKSRIFLNRELLSLNMCLAGRLFTSWTNSKDSSWKRTSGKPKRSWRLSWSQPRTNISLCWWHKVTLCFYTLLPFNVSPTASCPYMWAFKADYNHQFYLLLRLLVDYFNTYVTSGRSNETPGGIEETGGAPQPGVGETEADRDEVCFHLWVPFKGSSWFQLFVCNSLFFLT